MNFQKEMELLISRSNFYEELKKDIALQELKNKAYQYQKDNSSFFTKITNFKNKKDDNKYFANLKKAKISSKEEIKKYLSLKNDIPFKVIFKKFLQKQTTVSDFNSADTSYMKYEVFLQIDSSFSKDYQYFKKIFKNETTAKNYFNKLKNKIKNTDTVNLFNEILDDLNRKISLLEQNRSL